MGELVSDKAIEDGAKAVHEALLGSDTWLTASAAQRSRSRHAVRLVVAALSKHGAPVKLAATVAPTAASAKTVVNAESGEFRDEQW